MPTASRPALVTSWGGCDVPDTSEAAPINPHAAPDGEKIWLCHRNGLCHVHFCVNKYLMLPRNIISEACKDSSRASHNQGN